MTEEDGGWSPAELTRAFRRLEGRFDRLETKLDIYAAQFVTRELHDRDIAAVTDKLIDATKWLTDVAAEGERAQRERSTIREQMVTRDGLAPFEKRLSDVEKAQANAITRRSAMSMAGLLVAVVAAVATIVAIFVH